MPSKPIFIPSTANRLWAKAIDSILVWIFLVPAFGWTSGFFFGRGEMISVPWSLLAYLILVPIAYETLAIWIFGQTVGKWVFSLHVVSSTDDRAPVTGWQSVLRAVGGRYSLIFSHAIHAFMFYRHDRTHLVDWVAGTRVVASRARPDRPKPRAFVAGLAVLLFAVAGWTTASAFVKNLTFDRQGVTFAWPQPDQISAF